METTNLPLNSGSDCNQAALRLNTALRQDASKDKLSEDKPSKQKRREPNPTSLHVESLPVATEVV